MRYIIFLFCSCSSENVKVNPLNVNDAASINDAPLMPKEKEKQFKELRLMGYNSILTNNIPRYDSVISVYSVSEYPFRGINIAQVMAIKNGYKKAFLDIASLYPYKTSKYWMWKSEAHLLFLSSMSKGSWNKKKIGTKVFEKEIAFKDLGSIESILPQIKDTLKRMIVVSFCSDSNYNKGGYIKTEREENSMSGVEMYQRGLIAIEKNEIEVYNDVVRWFRRSRDRGVGLTLANLMLIKNGYGKSYFDIVSMYPYSHKQYYSVKSESLLMFYLSMANSLGHQWSGTIPVFGKSISVEDIESPEYYLKIFQETTHENLNYTVPYKE